MAFGLSSNLIIGAVAATLLTGGAYMKGRADASGAQAKKTIGMMAEERSTFRAVFATQVNATLAAVQSDLGNSEACIAAFDASDSARATFRRELDQAAKKGEVQAADLSAQLRALMAMQEDTNAGIAGAYDRLDPDIPCRVYGLADCYGDQPPAAVAYGVHTDAVRKPDADELARE